MGSFPLKRGLRGGPGSTGTKASVQHGPRTLTAGRRRGRGASADSIGSRWGTRRPLPHAPPPGPCRQPVHGPRHTAPAAPVPSFPQKGPFLPLPPAAGPWGMQAINKYTRGGNLCSGTETRPRQRPKPRGRGVRGRVWSNSGLYAVSSKCSCDRPTLTTASSRQKARPLGHKQREREKPRYEHRLLQKGLDTRRRGRRLLPGVRGAGCSPTRARTPLTLGQRSLLSKHAHPSRAS